MYIRVSANCRKIRSFVSTSRLGKKIYSFRGVRYAEPPTETALFSGKFFSFFSSLDYNSINSGKIPGAWTFVKLIVNLQLCGNKGNLPCFLFTYEYLSGGTFIRVGIILAIFTDCNTSGRLERCFRRFERGSRMSKFGSNGSQIQGLFAFERVYWKSIFSFLSKSLHTDRATYIYTQL